MPYPSPAEWRGGPPEHWGKKPAPRPEVALYGITERADGSLHVKHTDGSVRIIPAAARVLPPDPRLLQPFEDF